MAENRFAITLTAVDRASATLNKVNKNVNALFRPYDNAKRSIKSFSDTLGRNDLVKRPLWALEKVGAGITKFGSAFGVAETSVLGGSTRIASALGMIGGPVGGFLAAAGAVVGGTAGVGVAMAKTGQDITRTARNLNLSTTDLQEYRGAAKLAGLETRSMDQGLQALGETLQNADMGRAATQAEALAKMHISISRTRNGAVDSVKALRDIADVISHMKDANLQRTLTDMFGITDLLPLLRQGSGAIDEYIKKAKELGYVQSTDQINANNLAAKSWDQITTAINGAGLSLGNLIAKQAHLSDFAAWISKLAGGVKHWADGSAPKPEGSWGSSGGASGSWGSSTSPIGLRQNNPGNLRSWPGADRAGGFARFSTPEAGLTAMGKNLLAYQDKHGLNTISGIINRWAPSSENNTGAYISSVSKQTGFGANQPLDLHNPQVLAPLISAITKQENGQQPYSPDQISRAVADAIRDGMTAVADRPIRIENASGHPLKATRGLGQTSVGLSMAPGGMS